nr:hypothetical protein [Tanacetum cinerariifolium]
MQKIVKKQVKEHVKVQVSKILPKIKQTVNEQLEAEVLTQSSNSSKTSYAIAADLSEMELKKILIEKMEDNKSIQRSNEQRNLYKALRRRDDEADKDEEPFAGLNRGPRDAEKERRQIQQALQRRRLPGHPEWFSQQKKPPTPDHDWNKTLPATHGSIQPWISEHAKQSDSRSSFNELMDTPGSCKSLVELEFLLEEVYKATTDQLDWVNHKGQQYPHNMLKPLPLIPNSRGRRVIPFDHFINNDLEYLRGGASSRKYTTFVTKTKAADYMHIKIIAVTKLKIVDWHNYKHLDWITVRRNDDKLYKFKEGDFKRLRIQDIEDMLLLLVQGKLTNLTVEERFAFNVSFRMFTRSIRKEACSAYSNPRGFIYQNKDKQNRLMRIDELHKFSDGTLTNVRTALDNRLKGIQMKYLPQSIWRKSDKDRAAAMIQAIDKRLKTRRIMRSLERKLKDGGEAQAAALAAYEAKREKMLEEYNHYISLRAESLPITKIGYRIDNCTKQAFMRITRNNDLLNLTIKANNLLLKTLKAKFQWLESQVEKLGVPLLPQLTATGLLASEKKRKRNTEIIKEVFVSEYSTIDVMHRNLISPLGVEGSKGLVIKEPESGIFFYNGKFDLVFQREENSI